MELEAYRKENGNWNKKAEEYVKWNVEIIRNL